MSKNTNNVRFTGGDNLTGLLKMYHEVMMKNELYDGKGAYKLSYAGGESGPSFGGNQMDIAANKDARKILFTIIVNANNKVADLFLNSSAITALKNKLVPDPEIKTDFKDLLGAPEQVFGAKMTNTINKLLASDYGRQAIDQAYVSEIQKKAEKIEEIVAGIKQPAAQKFYSTTQGKVLLFDFDNQYSITKSGPEAKLVHFLNDGKTTTYSKNNISFSEQYNIDHHKQFVMGTKQAQNPQFMKNSAMRISNIENILGASQKVEVTSSTQPNKTTKIEYINKLIALITAKIQAIVTTTTANLQNKIQEDFDKDKTLLNKKYQNIYDTKKEELQKQLSAELAEITKQKQKEHDILWNARVAASKSKQAADPSYSVDINSNDIVALKAAEGNSLAKEKEKSAAALLEKFRISLIKEQQDDVEKTRLKWQKDATSKHDEFVSVCNNIIEAASESAQNEHSNVDALFEKAEQDMEKFLSGATKELFAD
jgi:hypothetical protein